MKSGLESSSENGYRNGYRKRYLKTITVNFRGPPGGLLKSCPPETRLSNTLSYANFCLEPNGLE
jgi:hypothetical protein